VPTYDYVCESCGQVLEVVHGIDGDGPAECSDCGGSMSKAFAAPTIHFKGSGWAKKDRRSTSGPVKPKATKEGEAPTAPGSAPAPDAGGGTDGGGATGDGAGVDRAVGE